MPLARLKNKIVVNHVIIKLYCDFSFLARFSQ